MRDRSLPRSLLVYVGVLAGALVSILVALTIRGDFGSPLWAWALFTVFLVVTEYADFNFNDEHARIGLSASEAVLVPMMIALSLEQLAWAATAAVFVREIRRIGSIKGIFNVAEFACAASAAGIIFHALGEPAGTFTPRDAIASGSAVLLHAVLTHLFTSGAIALAERRSFIELSRAATRAAFSGVAGSIVLGWVFAAAYLAAPWSIVLLPLVIGIFFIGYRAMLSQSRERERVEHVHAASRALAANPGLEDALVDFLKAVCEVASASEARVVLTSKDRPLSGDARKVWSGVRMGRVLENMKPLVDGSPMDKLGAALGSADRHLVLSEDQQGNRHELLDVLEASSLVAVPLLAVERTARIGGYLVVMNRLGADEFADSDAHLLAALADELVVTIDSHRLFAEVSEERERFRRIFQGSEDGICLLDGGGAVLAWNPAMERITGYAATSVLGHVWSDKVMVRDEHQRRIEGIALVEVPSESELEVVTRSGPTRWISVLASSVRDRGGMAWVILVHDATAEHQVEQAKSDFLSTISHELRTPLTTIKGALQILSREGELPAHMATQMVNMTSRGAERLERLVMNLLVVSQLESGTMPVFIGEVKLDELMRERIDQILEGHERTIFVPHEEETVIRADLERMSHAIDHLLENAVKFGGPQGQIKIETGRENGYARISISDEGPGIAAADSERIFERFVRLGDVLTRETQGPGVGLFIAKRSVEAMDGRIWVESHFGKGATFHVTIPLAHPVAVRDQADTA